MDMCSNSGGKPSNAGAATTNSSFLLKIKYNQNHTIQGSIQWLEKRKTVCFRSMMELMLLLKEVSGGTGYRSWDGEDGVISEVQKLKHISEL